MISREQNFHWRCWFVFYDRFVFTAAVPGERKKSGLVSSANSELAFFDLAFKNPKFGK